MAPAFVLEEDMEHKDNCECDACVERKDPYFETEYQAVIAESVNQPDPRVKNLIAAQKLMDLLDIPYESSMFTEWSTVLAVDLYNIFMDEEKLKVLISKLRNKAFW